jgi:hypothetical protein
MSNKPDALQRVVELGSTDYERLVAVGRADRARRLHT